MKKPRRTLPRNNDEVPTGHKYAWIKQHASNYSVTKLCQFMFVSRSAYYDWLRRRPTIREQEDSKLIDLVKITFKKGRENYGTRRIKGALLNQGLRISRRRIAKLMVRAELRCKTKRQFKATTDSKHLRAISPNLLNRQFKMAKPNQVYVGDTSAPCGYYLHPYSRRLALFGRCD
jgi:hypothetical protein